LSNLLTENQEQYSNIESYLEEMIKKGNE